ncbi:formylglycine-generating enzyme family protein [Gracilimonas sp. BCB1]|uniref:formylglycine-generating enzyme family protein n=1 Tax=Gracilimonas sp. BCB1 TaxID=3152362 RepID=UPI0032D99B4B
MRSQKNISRFTICTLTVMVALLVSLLSPVMAQEERVMIPAGSFHSILPEVKGEPILVDSFYLDRTAVTNEDFLQFLQENDSWKKDEIPSIFAAQNYLNHWQEVSTPGLEEIGENRPVTHVSWFAANAYCSEKGGRLPTLNEWEYSAQLMDFDSIQEMNRFSTELIGWYSSVDAKNTKAVGSTGIQNRHGVQDQFGLIMEWVEDYKPIIADELSLDCGTVGRLQQLGNIYSYAASIRYITRMSFNPKTTTGMVGFRCAYDIDAPESSLNTEL